MEFVGLAARMFGEARPRSSNNGGQVDVKLHLSPTSGNYYYTSAGPFSESWSTKIPGFMRATGMVGENSSIVFHNITVEVPVLSQA